MGIFDKLFRGGRDKTPEELVKEFAKSKAFKKDRKKHRALEGTMIEIECPACSNGRAHGYIGMLGIAELECDACGWSGSIYITK